MAGPVDRPRGSAARRARADEQRRAARARERRSRLLLGGAAGVAVLLVVLAVALVATRGGGSGGPRAAGGGEIAPGAPTGATTVEPPARRIADTSGIPGVLAWDTTGWPGDGLKHAGAFTHDHVTGPVRYPDVPPVGGAHNPIWMNAGAYDRPVPNERAVHDLEHGAVWITYRPGLPAAQVTALRSFVARQSLVQEAAEPGTGQPAGQANRYVVLSPWATGDLPAPVVISSWGRQLRVDNPSDARLQRFVDAFRTSRERSPEYGSSVDGIGVLTGGRPLESGSVQPNPAGSTG